MAEDLTLMVLVVLEEMVEAVLEQRQQATLELVVLVFLPQVAVAVAEETVTLTELVEMVALAS